MLFNKKGFKNVTLREVAKELSISYGNVTYHFKTKEQLIFCLYEDMLVETLEILKTFDTTNLLGSTLEAPKLAFETSMRYLFFYVDFIEIKRSYLELSLRLQKDNENRKSGYLKILKGMQAQGILRKDLTVRDLDYLMELSGAMRTFFFINLNPKDVKNTDLKNKYVVYVNSLLYPYLTSMGMGKYTNYLKQYFRD